MRGLAEQRPSTSRAGSKSPPNHCFGRARRTPERTFQPEADPPPAALRRHDVDVLRSTGRFCSFQSSIPPFMFETCSNPRPVRMAAAVVLRTPARQIAMMCLSLYFSSSTARAGRSFREMRRHPDICPSSPSYSSASRTSRSMGDREASRRARTPKVTIDLFFDRIDQDSLVAVLTGDEVSFTFAPVELTKRHDDPS